jgi:hypothetical protein
MDSQALYDMQNKALSIEEFKKLSYKVGLFYHEEDLNKNTSLSLATPYIQLSPMVLSNITNTEVTTAIFGCHKSIGIIIAKRKTGKTQFAAGIAVARASGKGFLGFNPINPQKVLYIEGETREDMLKISIDRACNALGVVKDSLGTKLFLHCTRDKVYKEIFNLSHEDYQNIIEADVVQNNIDFVIFDNLSVLIPGFRYKASGQWTPFYNWLRTLEVKNNISFMLIHHSNAANNAAGSSDIEAHCGEIFKLGNVYDEFNSKNFDENFKKAFSPYIKNKGALFTVYTERSKTFPEFNGEQFGAYLALNSENPTLGPAWERIEFKDEANKNDKLEPQAAKNIQPTIEEEWPEITDTRMLKILKYASKHDGEITRVKAEELTGLADSRTLDILNAMIAKKCLKPDGQGRARIYRIQGKGISERL